MAQAVGMKVICPRQRTPAVAYSVMTQEIQASIQGHPVATTPRDSVSLALPHLINVFLQRRGVGQKLVMKSGFLYCPFHIVAKP